MSARDDYPLGRIPAAYTIEPKVWHDLCDEIDKIDQLRDENDELRELLRQHVMDWGRCDHPADCNCSDARARRSLQPDLVASETDTHGTATIDGDGAVSPARPPARPNKEVQQ